MSPCQPLNVSCVDIIFYISTFGVDKISAARETRIQFKWRVNSSLWSSTALLSTCGECSLVVQSERAIDSEKNYCLK